MEEQAKKITYNVLDFTEYPGPRYREQGEDSGEQFYWDVLKPLFEKIIALSDDKGNAILAINLDNTAGYASSFLDEAFGNLAYDFSEKVVKEHLLIISNQEPDWVGIILNETIPEWQKKKENGTARKPNIVS